MEMEASMTNQLTGGRSSASRWRARWCGAGGAFVRRAAVQPGSQVRVSMRTEIRLFQQTLGITAFL
jgi:hypothetical protein